MLAFLQPQLDAANIAAQLQSTGLGLEAALGETGIESMLGFSALSNALRQEQYQGLFDLLSAQQSGGGSGGGSSNGSGGFTLSDVIDYISSQGNP